jgi:hypothetical protein
MVVAAATRRSEASKGRQSLVFLAQLEHCLRQGTTSVTEIFASLTTEYVYFEEFRSHIKSKSNSFYTVSVSATRLSEVADDGLEEDSHLSSLSQLDTCSFAGDEISDKVVEDTVSARAA